MALVCSITNQPADEPVVSKFGHIYEKRIIEKYLETHEGKCPHTGEPLSAHDLIGVKASKISKNEWDSLMVETFTLKQQLDTVRQELAQSLYQHDASCRVIARLVKERDEARSALVNMKAAINGAQTADAAPSAAAGTQAMEVDSSAAKQGAATAAAAAAGIPEAIRNKVSEHATELLAQRKKRQVSSSLVKPEDIAGYKVTTDHPGMHSASTPGVLCIDLHASGSQVVTGGADKTAIVLDRASGKEVAKLSGHQGRVLDVLFHRTEALILTASADATVMGWTPETKGRKKSYKAAFTLGGHQGEVVGLSLHPLADYVASASVDRSWGFHDVRAGQTLHRFVDAAGQGGYRSVGFHPDGILLGLGTAESALQVWDVKAQQNVVTFPGHKGAVLAVSFSENGYYLVTAAADNAVKLWDMRKQAAIASHDLEGLSTASFDYSGSYIIAGGASGPVVLKTKTLEVVRPARGEAPVTDAVWGADATFFATVSSDRSLKFWGK